MAGNQAYLWICAVHSLSLVFSQRSFERGGALAPPGTAIAGSSLLEPALIGFAVLEDLRCEDDPQWLELKRRLFFLLERLSQSGKLDAPRGVHLLSQGVSMEDLARCRIGAAAVQLFLQLTLVVSDPQTAIADLLTEPWPESQDQPWGDLSSIPWQAILLSRWPIFEILNAMRSTVLGALGPSGGRCSDLWAGLWEEERVLFGSAVDAGHAVGLCLRLPADSCPPARAAATLAVLSATMPCCTMVEDQLIREAQKEATVRWPVDLLQTPWPVLPLLHDAENRAISEELRREFAGELRGAIAYVHFGPGEMTRFHDIEASLASLERYWLDELSTSPTWPVFIFADAASAPTQAAVLRGRFPRMDLRIAIVSEHDLLWPMPHDHPFCSPGYRRAARFMAGPLYQHKALDNITHLLLIDTEFEFTHPVPWDPLRHLYEQRGQLAYWQTHYERTWNRTVYLTEISREFMRAHGLQPQIPELVQYWWDHGSADLPGGSFPVNVYGCIFAGAMSFFRSDLFRSYFQELDSWLGWSEYCWSPQNVLAIAAGFFLNDNELTELWVFGRHQNSTKTPDEGWNDSKKGRIPAG